MKIGKFTVLEELGRGAGSTVYRVRRTADGLEYALKVVPLGGQDGRRHFDQARNEFRIGRHLDHPNLVAIHAFETDAGWFTGASLGRLLLEYAPGRPMDRLPLLSVPRLVRIFEAIAAAVAHMHARGVIHADLKPENLILSGDTAVKVIDYGVAQFRGERPEVAHATRAYMAPETGTHKRIDERTDVYSFGATMYRLATLQPPPSGLLAAIRGPRELVRLYQPAAVVNPRVPPALSELIGACLSVYPEDRPSSMEAVRQALFELSRTPNSPGI